MLIEIEDEAYPILSGLVESRLRELHPEIRRSQHTEFRDHLKHELEVLERLSAVLKRAGGATTD
jgi:hypothetical protein